MQINQLVIFSYVCRITENWRFTENTKAKDKQMKIDLGVKSIYVASQQQTDL